MPILFTLRARWVLPIDSPPIAGGFVSVADGRIASVGGKNPALGPVQDLGDVILMPGLVNAHTHLEFSALPRPLGAAGTSLPQWIRQVIADRKRGDRDATTAIAAGLRESLSSGVTSVGEIATAPFAPADNATARPAVVAFQEAIGFSAARIDSAFADVEARLNATATPAGISPHAPYTVHPHLLIRLVVQLANSRRLPVAMHLAESREELELLSTGDGPFRDLLQERSMWDPQTIPRGTRPLDYLRTLATAPRSLVIHGNYLDADEIDFLGMYRDSMSVVYCPRTHAFFGHAPYPLPAMLNAGVHLALGTDSRASNPDLNLLAELQFVAAQFPAIAPQRLLEMATQGGAKALGLDREAGSLTIGKRADLLALPLPAEPNDPHEATLHNSARPVAVWLAGRRVDLNA